MNNARRLSLSSIVGAVGIVYGDIGTSPLYTMQEAVNAAGTFDATAVLGVLSLIFWALAISVSLKYVTIIMRADNDGEGGILALFALAQRRLIPGSTWGKVAIGLALAGTAFFFCDALITPAISVLSAVEGLELLSPDLKQAVVPITLIVLTVLFAYQRHGTARVGSLFGPIMVVWFVVIAAIGIFPILRHPQVLAALNPLEGVGLLLRRPQVALAVIGAVFLALTGAEALYADMGHFGRTPVRVSWYTLVAPALVIDYFGQGALLLELGKPVDHPLYHLVPAAVLPWLVALATAATVIASQAVISGAFSMARQAVHLDLLPRLRVLQTSALEHGQIYVPIVNWLVFIAVCGFVVGFGSSDALSGAYGAAVVGTMIVTTILGAFVAATQWNWPKWQIAAIFGLLLLTDCAYVAGNMTKVPTGGWIPLTLGAILCLIFMTWRSGRLELRAALAKLAVPRSELPKLVAGVHRVPGTGVFLASNPQLVPSALIRNIEHNCVVHQRVIILNVEIADTPRQDPVRRLAIEEVLPGVFYVSARFGFMETPDVAEALKACRARGLRVFTEDSSFFVGRHVVRPRPLTGLRGLQRRLFARMQQYSTQAAEFFRMPFRDVVILNTAVEI
ncbi:MAG TPA: KUP/HAK/KT family potassium transporter [Steroidobacteraceae bacterium]|jgi:KUP system potassium uptake protein|nr:KUP/HAK/KT family potassium transporter [Steroidobacteraceae bacterium]